MATLLTTFSIQEILVFIVLFAVAVKGVVSFLDWAYARLRKIFIKEQKQQNDSQQIELRFEKDETRVEELAGEHVKFNNDISEIKTVIKNLERMDKNDIKAWLTEKHHHFTDKGWVDDYSLDCIEHRYQDYIALGGNSFIKNLMKEIRALPKRPPRG